MRIPIYRLFAAAAFVLGISHGNLFGQEYFVPIQPCRITDTRIAYKGAGPIAGDKSQNFSIAGICNVPSTATAYSLNITVVPPPGGILQYLTLYQAGLGYVPNVSTLNDYLGTVVANAAIVPAGSNGQVAIYVSDTTDVIIDADGYFVSQTSTNQNTVLGAGALASNGGQSNTAVGVNSLSSNTGNQNTAAGFQSLFLNSTGQNNSAFGVSALASNTTGSNNAAMGVGAALNNTSGNYNVAVGSSAGHGFKTGSGNVAVGYQTSNAIETDTSYTTAVGYQALNNNTGNFNTGVGYQALYALTTGTSNIALGPSAGSLLTTGSNNIEIGNTGTSTDNGAIRIGTQGTETATYIAGIYGATVSGAPVLINSSGQLGVQFSSIRFKEDVHDMADASNGLMKLRPVQFRYKQAEADGSKPLQFGLVAEEVAQVYPELVVRGKDGQVDAVQYHQLPAMLLNHLQKQRRTIEDQQEKIADQGQEIKDLKAELESLRALVSK